MASVLPSSARAVDVPAFRRDAPRPGVAAATRRRDPVLAGLYPEYDAGGFTRDDQRTVFFSRVNALLEPGMTVLDFGAGRGRWAEEGDHYPARLATLKGKCRRVVGVDVTPDVLANPLLDEAVLVGPGGALPFADASFDMIVSFAVFEHLADPAPVARELDRVLKPGGWLCAWTPNRWGLVALAARLTPARLEGRLLRLVDARGEKDVFPKRYRLNTRAALEAHFPPPRYGHHGYTYDGQPGYFGRSAALARLWRLAAAATPGRFGKIHHVFLHKR